MTGRASTADVRFLERNATDPSNVPHDTDKLRPREPSDALMRGASGRVKKNAANLIPFAKMWCVLKWSLFVRFPAFFFFFFFFTHTRTLAHRHTLSYHKLSPTHAHNCP